MVIRPLGNACLPVLNRPCNSAMLPADGDHLLTRHVSSQAGATQLCEIYNNYLTRILTQALQMLFLFPEQMESRLKELMSSTLQWQ